MKKRARLLVGLSLLSFAMAPAYGAIPSGEELLHRDYGYEENLRVQASVDNKITPARVIRWMRSLAGHAITAAPSATEFEPIVNVHEGRVRIIAAFNYKF